MATRRQNGRQKPAGFRFNSLAVLQIGDDRGRGAVFNKFTTHCTTAQNPGQPIPDDGHKPQGVVLLGGFRGDASGGCKDQGVNTRAIVGCEFGCDLCAHGKAQNGNLAVNLLMGQKIVHLGLKK